MSTLEERLRSYLNDLPGDFTPAVEAEKFVALAGESFAAELEEWMQASARKFITRAMSDRLRSERARAARRVACRAFAAASAAHDEGDDEPLDHFTVTYTIDGDNTRRRLGDMTGADHQFVAGLYEQTGKRDLLFAAFHRAVAKKVGKRRTADVLDVEKYEQLMRSFVNPNAAQTRLVA